MRTATLRSIALLVLAVTLSLGSAAQAQKLLWEHRVEAPAGFQDDDFIALGPAGTVPFIIMPNGGVVFCVGFSNGQGAYVRKLVMLSSNGTLVGKVDLPDPANFQVIAVAGATSTKLSIVGAIGADCFLKSYTLNRQIREFIESGSLPIVYSGVLNSLYSQAISPGQVASGAVLGGRDDSGLWIRRYSAF